MKKMICVLLTALLLCLSGLALAEEAEAPAEPFEHLWVNEADEDDTVEIWFNQGAWDLLAMRFAGEDVYSVLFDRVFYDEAQKALICEGGSLYFDRLADEEENEEAEADLGEVTASGFGAALTVDEEGLLHWTGSGDAWADRVYANWDFVDDGLFTGKWECDGSWVFIDLRHGVYEVYVLADANDNELVSWEYTCVLDESGRLTGAGAKYVETYSQETEEYIETIIYSDGKASFTLDGDILAWNDGKEDAGKDMTFTRYIEEDEQNER